MTGASPMVEMGPVTFEKAVSTSEPLHSPVGGVPPPAEVVLGFCCRIGATTEIVDADDAIPWVSVELGVDKGLLRHPNAGINPGVLRFFQRTSARDDPGPERSPADGCLAAHVELPAAQVASLVDLLQGEQSGLVFGFGRMVQRLCWQRLWRVLHRRE